MAIRITQETAELAEATTSARIRATQITAETAQLPTTARIRMTQLVIELAMVLNPSVLIGSGSIVGAPGVMIGGTRRSRRGGVPKTVPEVEVQA